MKPLPSRRLLTCQSSVFTSELASTRRPFPRAAQPFSQSSLRSADEDDAHSRSPPARPFPRSPAASLVSPSLHPKASAEKNTMKGLINSLRDVYGQNNQARSNLPRINMDTTSSDGNLMPSRDDVERPPHRLHVYATRHNTHITITGPPGCKVIKQDLKKDKPFGGGVIISMSAGNIGFKKSGRKHYDSAFQLASYVMTRLQEAGVSQDIQKLEFFCRGYGAGREAVTKALLGTEGRLLRGKVVSVADATRLKFGGTRSRKPRRLG